MWNVMWNGAEIKTKGLHEQSTKSSARKRETKRLTDCYFFTQFGKCEGNHGKTCQYRHFDFLQRTKEICPSWNNKSCTNLRCPKLHPSQRHYKGGTINLNSVDAAVSRSKNVVFHSNNPGSNHSITRMHSGINAVSHSNNAHSNNTVATMHRGINAVSHSNNSHSNNAVFHSNNVHSNNAVATMHSGINGVSYSSNARSNYALSNNVVATMHSGINTVPIGIFWDLENCQIPKNKSALAVVKSLRDRFYTGHKEAEFICVCDTKKEKREVLEDLNKAQVNIVHINATSKNAADDKLKQALQRFSHSHQTPATILLVSGDINFVADLSDLRYRHKFHVILVHNKQASKALIQCAHECECFDVFTKNILPNTPTLMSSATKESVNLLSKESNQLAVFSLPHSKTESNQLAVFNLPHCKTVSIERITNRLSSLTQNTGGKVIKVNAFKSPGDNKAVIVFPNVDCARRALQRINNEDVFGYTIKVFFYFEKNKNKENKEKHLRPQHNRENVKVHENHVHVNYVKGRSQIQKKTKKSF